MIYEIYRNKLINATYMANNGCTTLSVYDRSRVGQTGHDDHESELAGYLTLDDSWTLAINQLGEPLLKHADDALVVIEGEYSEGITTLPKKYPGIRYVKSIDGDSIYLPESEEWLALESNFLED